MRRWTSTLSRWRSAIRKFLRRGREKGGRGWKVSSSSSSSSSSSVDSAAVRSSPILLLFLLLLLSIPLQCVHHQFFFFFFRVFNFVTVCSVFMHTQTNSESKKEGKNEGPFFCLSSSLEKKTPSRRRKNERKSTRHHHRHHALTPPNFSSSAPIVVLLGLSIGRPSALLHTPWLSSPMALETPKSTV